MAESTNPSIPARFVTVCRLAAIADDEIKKTWENVQNKSVADSLNWLIKDAGLSDEQLDKLDKLFTATKDGKESINNWQNLLDQILEKTQREAFPKKYSEFLMINLGDCYEKIIMAMSVEQRQVLRAMEQGFNAYA